MKTNPGEIQEDSSAQPDVLPDAVAVGMLVMDFRRDARTMFLARLAGARGLA